MPDTSDKPIVAPADYETRERTEDRELGSLVVTGGPGWPTELVCGVCSNAQGNLQIWHSWWVSRNGDATSNDEVRCARCRMYTLYITEH